jgi:hypothetical protein
VIEDSFGISGVRMAVGDVGGELLLDKMNSLIFLQQSSCASDLDLHALDTNVWDRNTTK